MTTTGSAHFVLVPGFWLGAWAWDAVAAELRAAGQRVSAMTLPGLASALLTGPVEWVAAKPVAEPVTEQ